MIGSIQVVGTFLTILIIEKFGRKLLLIISDFFICVSMVGVAIFFKMYEDCPECQNKGSNNFALDTLNSSASVYVSEATVNDIGWLLLASLMLFILAFSIGFGPIPWVMNVELMPPEARVIS